MLIHRNYNPTRNYVQKNNVDAKVGRIALVGIYIYNKNNCKWYLINRPCQSTHNRVQKNNVDAKIERA